MFDGINKGGLGEVETKDLVQMLSGLVVAKRAFGLEGEADVLNLAAERLEKLSGSDRVHMDVRDTERLGFKEKHTGTRLLRYAVNYIVSTEPETRVPTMELYCRVGERFGLSRQSAERNMRSACRAAGYTNRLGDQIRWFAQMARDGQFG